MSLVFVPEFDVEELHEKVQAAAYLFGDTLHDVKVSLVGTDAKFLEAGEDDYLYVTSLPYVRPSRASQGRVWFFSRLPDECSEIRVSPHRATRATLALRIED